MNECKSNTDGVITSELRYKVEGLVLDLIQKAQEYFKARGGYNKIYLPVIRYDLTGGSSGQCIFPKDLGGEWVIRINSALFNRNQEYFFNTTIPHEIAHGVTFSIFGGYTKPHGVEWKYVMYRVFNIVPHRTHFLDTTGLRRKKTKYRYVYNCTNCSKVYNLTSLKHKRITNYNTMWYVCGHCKGKLGFTGIRNSYF